MLWFFRNLENKIRCALSQKYFDEWLEYVTRPMTTYGDMSMRQWRKAGSP